jgi:5-methyltetrahydrofolate--homocysteine methyltransferase
MLVSWWRGCDATNAGPLHLSGPRQRERHLLVSDEHPGTDVGKNLVDIILSNNGFKVVNIGIKADIELFIEKLEEYYASVATEGSGVGNSRDGLSERFAQGKVAIGMSGLLVKSTQVMKENLEELKQRGYKVPVLLGGAALNIEFVHEYCRPIYDGAIIYSRDAFDAITTLTQIEKGEEITIETPSAARAEAKEAAKGGEVGELIKPQTEEPPIPPFWGRYVWEFTEAEKLLAFEWLNRRMLFKERWGYKSKGIEKAEYEKQLKEVIEPAYERLKKEFKTLFYNSEFYFTTYLLIKYICSELNAFILNEDCLFPKLTSGSVPINISFDGTDLDKTQLSIILFK